MTNGVKCRSLIAIVAAALKTMKARCHKLRHGSEISHKKHERHVKVKWMMRGNEGVNKTPEGKNTDQLGSKRGDLGA